MSERAADIKAAWEKLHGEIRFVDVYESPMEALLAKIELLEAELVETDKILAAEVENVRIGEAEEKRLRAVDLDNDRLRGHLDTYEKRLLEGKDLLKEGVAKVERLEAAISKATKGFQYCSECDGPQRLAALRSITATRPSAPGPATTSATGS